MVVHAPVMPNVYGRQRGDAGDVAFAPPEQAPVFHDNFVTMLLVAAFCVYALQRTYPPGS